MTVQDPTASARRYGKGRPRFTREQRSRWVARFVAGESVPSLAKAYSCSAETIYHHLRVTGNFIPTRDRYQATPPAPGAGRCVRCGIDMGMAGMCIDCLEVEGLWMPTRRDESGAG